MLRFSGQTRCDVLIFCVLAIFCLQLMVAAQSRPQTKENTASTQPTAPVETSSAETDDKNQDDDKKVQISSLKVVGKFQQNLGYFMSNHLDNALGEFVRTVESNRKLMVKLTKGGKMTYTEAKEKAKKETGIYYLWLGYAAKSDEVRGDYIEFVQYAILKPETGEVLMRGQIKPLRNRVPNPGGGTVRLPTINQSWDLRAEMQTGSRNIAEILMRNGWLN